MKLLIGDLNNEIVKYKLKYIKKTTFFTDIISVFSTILLYIVATREN